MRFSLRFMESEVLAGHTGEHLAGRRTELYFSRGPARSLKAWPAVAVASREAGVAPTRWSPVWWAESWILLISWCSYTTHYLLLTLDRLSLFSHWKYPPFTSWALCPPVSTPRATSCQRAALLSAHRGEPSWPMSQRWSVQALDSDCQGLNPES